MSTLTRIWLGASSEATARPDCGGGGFVGAGPRQLGLRQLGARRQQLRGGLQAEGGRQIRGWPLCCSQAAGVGEQQRASAGSPGPCHGGGRDPGSRSAGSTPRCLERWVVGRGGGGSESSGDWPPPAGPGRWRPWQGREEADGGNEGGGECAGESAPLQSTAECQTHASSVTQSSAEDLNLGAHHPNAAAHQPNGPAGNSPPGWM